MVFVNKMLSQWSAVPKKELRIPIICATLLMAVSFTPLKIAALLGCIVLLALYWPFPRFVNSFVLRLVLAFVLTTCLQQLTAALFWLMRVDFTVPAVVITELIVVLCLTLTGFSKPVISKVALINRADAIAVGVSLASIGLIGYFMLSGGTLLQQLVRQTTTGYDNVQHISLTQTLYENKGYYWGPIEDVIEDVKFWNMGSYPQGWSLTTSIWWQAITPEADIQERPGLVLSLYVAFFLLWYALTVYMFCRLVCGLVELMRNAPLGPAALIGAVMFTLLAQIVFLLAMLYNGFASFMPALLFPLALAYLTAATLAEPAKTPIMFMITGLLIAGGVAFSWLLIAPAVYIAVAIALVALFNGRLSETMHWLFGRPWRPVIAAILVGTASVQGYVQLAYGVDDLVNMPGGINDLNSLLLFTSLLLAAAIAGYYKRGAVINSFVAVISGGLIVSGIVYLYQFFSSGTATYFSTKAAYVPFMLILAFGAAGIIAIVDDFVARKSSQFMAATMLIAAVLFIPIATNVTLGTSPALGIGAPNYLTGKRFLSHYSASQVSALMADNEFGDGDRLVMFKHLGFAEDVTTTHFINMVTRKHVQSCNTIIGDLTTQWALNRDSILKCAGANDIYIVTSTGNFDEVSKTFADDAQVKVILSN